MESANKSTQTAKNSTRCATPTRAAFENTPAVWKPLNHWHLKDAKFSDVPDVYLVSVTGNRVRLGKTQAVDSETVVEAFHPYMALGEAIEYFKWDCESFAIEKVNICKRVINTLRKKSTGNVNE